MLQKAVASAVVVVLAGLGPVAAPAAAHAKLQRAAPAPGAMMREAPRVVRVWFVLAPGEDLDAARSRLVVIDSRGRRVDDGKGGVDLDDLDRRSMIARLHPLAPGTYTVQWTAVSAPDGDVARGAFRFTVAAAGGAALPPLAIVSPRNGAVVANPVVVVIETPADLRRMTMGAAPAGGGHAMGAAQMTPSPGGAAMPQVHLHVAVGRRVEMPTMKHLRPAGRHRWSHVLSPLPAGRHTIRVYWGDDRTHEPVGRVVAATVTVRR
ncbi:MAG: copper resistance protein CopC [Armatimonadota bacterium]|nr:copper resistance protein CopC [Armatimonadota bacterium]MDR7534377.1 copper resistance protein CopC [Armatimonadota bacterium]